MSRRSRRTAAPGRSSRRSQVPAADSDATGVANALGDIEIVRVVDENPTDLKTYGLDAPRIEVEFKSADGKTAGHLLVGAKTATGGNLYAQTRRSEARRAHRAVSRELAQQVHVRSARQDDRQVRSRPRSTASTSMLGGKTDRVRQGRHRLEDDRSRSRPAPTSQRSTAWSAASKARR